MLCFHLHCPSNGAADSNSSNKTQNELAQQRREWLETIEAHIWRALGAQGRSEARLWLCSAIGSIPVPRHLQPPIFLDLIRQPRHKNQDRVEDEDAFDKLVSHQLLRIFCEKRPRTVMRLFAKDSKLIRSFFSGHPKRILWWFANFASVEKKGHQLGAQALAQFAFIHRDSCWNELEWKGSHGQAPATLASKPHYFLDLDVLRTVENFLDNVPTFWSSQELWDSLKEGELLPLDMDFFIEELQQRMSDKSSEVWRLLKSFLSEETFSDLCQRLLSLVNDNKLLAFITDLGSVLSKSRSVSISQEKKGSTRHGGQITGTGSKYVWLEEVIYSGATCLSLDCAIICNACVVHARQIFRIFQEEDNKPEVSSLNHLLSETKCRGAFDDKQHWALRKDGLTSNKWEAVKWLALESWVCFFFITEEYMSIEILEALLAANAIEFRHCAQDLADDVSQGQSRLKTKKDQKNREERKRKRKRKKRRRKPIESDGEVTGSSQSEDDYSRMGCLSKEGGRESWYLSIDNFTVGLDKEDLPEHLASYAFGEWFKWVSLHW